MNENESLENELLISNKTNQYEIEVNTDDIEVNTDDIELDTDVLDESENNIIQHELEPTVSKQVDLNPTNLDHMHFEYLRNVKNVNQDMINNIQASISTSKSASSMYLLNRQSKNQLNKLRESLLNSFEHSIDSSKISKRDRSLSNETL